MSYITDMEEVIDEVADWAVSLIQETISALMPDGKPFLMELKTEDDQIEEYMALRGNPEAWTKFIAENTSAIILELQDSGLDADLINTVHPADIAQKFAISWSADMEKVLERNPDYAILIGSREMAPTGREVLPA